MITDINSEDRLVQQTFADYLHDTLGWDSVFAWNDETFGPHGTLSRDSERDAVLKRDLHQALTRLNPALPDSAQRGVSETDPGRFRALAGATQPAVLQVHPRRRAGLRATPAARLATTMPAFHHNAFLVVSNGDRAKYGSITSKWDHFAEWKRKDEKEKGDLEQPRSGPCR